MSLSTCGVHEFCSEKFKLVKSFSCPSSVLVNMIYCSVKYCCLNSSIPGVILHSIMKSIKTPYQPACHWSTLWPLEVWVRGMYNSWWFCVHKLSMFIYLSMLKYGWCLLELYSMFQDLSRRSIETGFWRIWDAAIIHKIRTLFRLEFKKNN